MSNIPPDSNQDPRQRLPSGPVDAISIALRFAGPDLNPDTITALLGRAPTIAYRAGDHIRSRLTTTGRWIWEGPRLPHLELEPRLLHLFDQLPPDRACWEQLSRFHGDLFCGLWLGSWNRGLDLSPALSQALADRHLRLSLDIYFEGAADNTDDSIPAE